jgi:hypothetical protein
MPAIKAAFARVSGVSPTQHESLGARLPKIGFQYGEGLKVTAVDREPARRGEGPRLVIEAVQRTLRDARRFDDGQNKIVSERVAADRILTFDLDLESGIARTPGGFRDMRALTELLRQAGGGKDVEEQRIAVDLLAWVKETSKLYETAQLSQVVVDGLFIEPRLIGRYIAKSVDNRLDLAYLQEVAGQLRSLRLGFFHEGVRRGVEARVDGVLSISSSDEEDAGEFFDEQRRVMLSHSTAD